MKYEVNPPPTPGTLTVAPAQGIALIDSFTITASGFIDTDLPLLYSFSVYQSEEDYNKD